MLLDEPQRRSLGRMGVSIAVVGPGAIGSTVVACLHRVGHTPALCGRTAPDHLDVRPDPAVLAGERIVVPVAVLTDPGEIRQPVELVLLAVKATQIGQASTWLAALCDHNTTVCVLENGVEQVELVQPPTARFPMWYLRSCGVPPKRNLEDGCGFAGNPN
jgi:2-dehydropantoate 2-reductase